LNILGLTLLLHLPQKIHPSYANIRIVNKLVAKAGPRTVHVPSGEEGDIFDVAMKLSEEAAWGVIQKKNPRDSFSPPFALTNQTKPNQTTKTKNKLIPQSSTGTRRPARR
jgi:hypothetical protein